MMISWSFFFCLIGSSFGYFCGRVDGASVSAMMPHFVCSFVFLEVGGGCKVRGCSCHGGLR